MPFAVNGAQLPSAPPGGESAPSFEALLSLGLYVAIAVLLIGVLLFLARFLGQKSRSESKGQAYESGILPTGLSRLHEPVPFYLVAIFFIVFDVEAVFIVSWAVAYDLLGWAGFAQITFFIVVLFLALVYLWKMGGLDWGPSAHRRPRKGREA
jgi:NADH-quinone oxidoreductase subunit A